MTVQEIIDLALSQGDNVSPSDAAYVERRRRALSYLRETFNTAYFARNWPRRKATATVTVPANAGKVLLPVDFASLGVYGSVFVMVGGVARDPQLEEVPESEIMSLRNSGQNTTQPEKFAIFDFGETTPGSGIYCDYIQVPPNEGNLTLQLTYQRKPPKLLDAGDPDEAPGATLTAGNVATNYIWDEFHERVLLVGTKAKLRESKGDARWAKLQADYEEAVKDMKKEKNRFQAENRQLPSFFGRG